MSFLLRAGEVAFAFVAAPRLPPVSPWCAAGGTLVNGPVEETDDDSDLIALGRQFEEIAANVQKLHNSASPNDHLELVEAMLGRLYPIERAIMQTPARTMAGLSVKARHAAYVTSQYWEAPVDKLDWDARAVRLLIEAVCDFARTPLPFRNVSNDE
jgi:hypothetical protein